MSLGIVCFRINPGGADLDEDALTAINRNVLARIFWEARAFISSGDAPGRVRAEALHPQPHHDLGRRARNAGDRRAIRDRGVVEASTGRELVDSSGYVRRGPWGSSSPVDREADGWSARPPVPKARPEGGRHGREVIPKRHNCRMTTPRFSTMALHKGRTLWLKPSVASTIFM